MKQFTLPYLLLLWLAAVQLSGCAWKSHAINTYPEIIARSASNNSEEWKAVQQRYTSYMEALTKNKDDNRTKIKLAELYLAESRMSGNPGYYNEAVLQVVDDILNAPTVGDDVHYSALTYKATTLLSLHRFEEARVLAEKALQLNPYEADIYGALVDAHVELGQYDKAVRYCDKMMAIRPDIRSYSRVSYLRQINGDIPGAKAAMRLAVEAGAQGQENTEWARVQLGNLYLQTGHADTATMLFESSLFARAGYAPAEIGLAKAKAQQKKWEEAINHAKNAIRIHAESSYVSLLAQLYGWSGNATKAKQTHVEVLALIQETEKDNKKTAAAWHNGNRELAEAYYHAGQYPQALQYAVKDWEPRKNNIDANELIARIYVAKQQYPLALQYMQTALATHTKQAAWFQQLAKIYVGMNQNAKAQQYREKAMQINPTASTDLPLALN